MAEHESAQPAHAIAFGPFRLLPSQQLLLEHDRPVLLGSRALDILLALVSRPGEVVGKTELIEQVWPSTYVDETNLRVHMTALRKALRDGQDGNRYIITIPGRGYRFVAPVDAMAVLPQAGPLQPGPLQLGPPQAGPPQAGVPEPLGLPPQLTQPIGRAGVIAALTTQLQLRRFVTLCGPGGIGKTTVALAVARRLAASNRDGIGFVDLGPIGDPALVASALAAVLGLAVASENPLPGVLATLRQREMLLVLDNCEHVIEAAAVAAEDIFEAAPGVQILATSREPLRVVGEHVHRLTPLESPPASAGLTAAAALEFPSVQLFVERAAAFADFQLDDADAPVVADICRRLDGIALAIELAAGRVAAFGLHDLARRLDDRFRLLMSGRRTALPRHQTLAATLEWSEQLLPEAARTLLRRLAVFAGEFTLEAAVAVAAEGAEPQAVEHIADLVAKSLVTADLRSDRALYRLLGTTRLYCLEKLRGGRELADAARRHAQYYRDFFARAEADGDTLPKAAWLGIFAGQIDNLRAALEWAFGPAGDPALGVALALAAVPLWVELSLMAECRAWVERALALLDGDAAEPAMQARMRLNTALGWSRTFAAGPAGEAWAAALALAERLGDTDYRLRALWGLWVDSLNNGALPRALDLARQFEGATADPVDRLMADRMLATTLHFTGEQGQAREHIERMLRRYTPPRRRPQIVQFHLDAQVAAHFFQARILWLQGFAGQATRIADGAVTEAQSLGQPLLLASALGQGACPIALFTGDLDAAERHVAMLLDHTARHALESWHQWARCFAGLVQAGRGGFAAGVQTIRAALAEAGASRLMPRYLPLLGEYAHYLGRAGEAAAGAALVEAALARCERSGEYWYVSELLRIRGELALLADPAGAAAAAAVADFAQARDLADRQGALAWDLRAATSLARLRPETRPQLAELLGRFVEDFDTGDLRAARRLLA